MSYLLRDSMNYAALQELLHGEHNVSRVIARPFKGTKGNYERTRTEEIMPFFHLRTTCLCTLRLPGRMS